MRFSHFILLVLLVGCSPGYNAQMEQLQRYSDNIYEQSKHLSGQSFITHMRSLPSYASAMHMVDSLLAQPPRVRSWNDSLAREDSLALASLHLKRVQDLYYGGDTTAAVFAYLGGSQWFVALKDEYETDQARRFAETAADALKESLSPNMASLAHDAFLRAIELANKEGDVELLRLAHNSFLEVSERVIEMPDSVRLAFAPSKAPASSLPWGGILALAIGFIVSAGGLRVYKQLKDKPRSTSLTLPVGTTEAVFEALWLITHEPQAIPKQVQTIVHDLCRKPTNQRATFMMAGLMALASDPEQADPLKVANAVRSRLLRHFKKQELAFGPGVVLPREQDEWREWFAAHEDLVPASCRKR